MATPNAATTLTISNSTLATPASMVGNCGIGGATGSRSLAAVTTLDKAAQCVVLESRGEATQTDPASFSAAGCQTDTVLPAAQAETPNVFCELCCRFFFQKGGMFRHWRLHHGLEMSLARWEPYQCPQCPFASNAKELVLVHERTHETEKAHARQIAAQRCAQITRDAEFIKDSVCSCCKEPASREKCEKYQDGCEPCACRLCPQHSSEVTEDDSSVRRLVKKQHICKVCLKGFRRRDELVAHAVVHTDGRRFVCDICQRGYLRKSSLVCHRKTHTNSRPFECSVCQKRFQYKRALNTHSAVHSGERPFECSVCQRRFNDKRALNAHSAVHTGESPLECSVCQKHFHHKHALNAHLVVHSGKEPFECEVCQKSYPRKDSLDAHRRTHTGNRPFECSVCQKRFFYHRSLEDHLTIHAKATNLECDMHSKRFAPRRDADVHSVTHTGEGPFECDVCKKRFLCKEGLEAHTVIHTDNKVFECEVCFDCLSSKEDLDAHLASPHPASVETSRMPYECGVCQKRFSRRYLLLAHKKTHAERTVKAHRCHTCRKAFACEEALAEHERTAHLREKPYECIVCHETFPQRAGLVNHDCTLIMSRMAAASAQTASIGDLE